MAKGTVWRLATLPLLAVLMLEELCLPALQCKHSASLEPTG